jgi:Mn-dependent DtxR family transcriptional regulator
MTHSLRASYQLCLVFLACVQDGLSPHGIKERLDLSRYSYEYTLNKLLRLRLIDYKGNQLTLTDRGVNVLSYSAGASASHNEVDLKVTQ